jgi:PAS domain S-box-containing protein
MRVGVRAREAIAVTLLTFLVAATTSLVHLAQLSRVVVEEDARQADLIARQISAQAGRVLGATSGRDTWRALRQSAELRSLIDSSLGSSPHLMDVMLVDERGHVVIHGERQKEGTSAPTRITLTQLLNVDAVRRLIALVHGGAVYEASLPLTLNGRPFGSIRLGLSSTLIRRELAAAVSQSLVVTGLAIVAAWVVAIALADVVLRPVRALVRDVSRLRQGELLQLDGTSTGGDELGELGAQLRLLGKQVETERVRMLTEKSTIQQMVDHLEDAVILFNQERRILSFSRAAEGILGAPLDHAIGRALDELVPEEHPLRALLADALARPQGVRNRTVALDVNGESRDYLVTVWPVTDGDQLIGAMALFRNLQSIRSVRSLISYSAKLAALGGLTSGVTHEVKNPLNALMIHLEIIRSKLGARSDDVGRSLEVMGTEIRRLDRVVQGFLKFARPQELKLTPVDLGALLASTTSLLEEEWRAAGIRFVLGLHPDLPLVTGDEELLRQAFLNIVQNACQAMPSGGAIVITAAPVEEGMAQVCVSDEGVGIPGEELEKIFQLYYTTRPDGNGIGLSLVYRIVQMHDGSIEVASEVDRGTAVTVRLPAG